MFWHLKARVSTFDTLRTYVVAVLVALPYASWFNKPLDSEIVFGFGCFIISPHFKFFNIYTFSDGIFDGDHKTDIIFLLWRLLGGAPSYDDVIFSYFDISRKLLALEAWNLYQATQNIWFIICSPYIILSYLH